MRFTEREEAVSPVIGVILMVAITVILAAVIGAFVFGMAGDVQGAKIVQITGNVNSTGGTNHIDYTIMGGSSINEL
ncbi:MAG: type IV pilin N-terminal domain-containing protein, partial [Euryarchaeota archaeon]|nr:type IV pilin N-terminal domain-containing protein [Euryarchaeota archaeon]